MAFHVACPISCRRICDCSLGFSRDLQSDKGKNGFLEEIAKLEVFLKDPWSINDGKKTVQVVVPKVVVAPPPPSQVVLTPNDAVGEAEELLSAQTKRASMQKKAAAVSSVAEDYARRFESGDMVVGVNKDLSGEEQGFSNVKVICRLCFSGDNEESDRARKMLSCKSCKKKYHRSCLKAWGQNRDLFHWSSWTCPSCRICEVCRRTGDPNKLMFCKRCDGAYHCYCQQPPHKNVSNGPYLCPKHTKCHSCASTVPGNGLSVRWFLGYTCCDACGRLFVKGNYCPVCLKVYRDSESTPMVCCDVCQRWVHCHCDGISDEKYLQFQVDNTLRYSCATCRGECFQVRDLEDAVQELWRRRDKADQDLTASLRAAAGLPTQEDIFSITPYSDEEDNEPPLKNEYSRSLKYSLKGVVDKSPKKSKEKVKKSSNKKQAKRKGFLAPVFEGHSDAQSIGYIMSDNKDQDGNSHISGSLKQKFVNEVSVKTEIRVSRDHINTDRPHGSDTLDNIENRVNKSKNSKGPKLVIHLGGRNKNVATSPQSDASKFLQEQELTTSNGENTDQTDQIKELKLKGKEGKLIKIKKSNPENSNAHQSVSPVKPRISFSKRSTPRTTVIAAGTSSEAPAIRAEKASNDLNDNKGSHASQKELKPLLRLKFKNPYSSWAPPGEEDPSSVKGQRSKRKRASAFMEKSSSKEDEEAGVSNHQYNNNMMGEIMDAKWIIQKLGNDAIGKKVEVHRSSNDSWHKGTITNIFEGASTVSVTLDDGKSKNVDIGKQGIRFVSQKQRR